MSDEELADLQDILPWAGGGIPDIDIWHDDESRFEKTVEEMEAYLNECKNNRA